MLKKALLLFSFLIPFMADAYIAQLAKAIPNKTGPIIWFAGDYHMGKKAANNNSRQKNQLLEFAEKQKALVLVEDQNAQHLINIEEMTPASSYYDFDLQDQLTAAAKKNNPTFVSKITSNNKIPLISYVAILCHLKKIPVKNIEYRFQKQFFKHITAQQFFGQEQVTVEQIKQNKNESTLSQFIQDNFNEYIKKRDEKLSEWFEELKEAPYDNFYKCLKQTSASELLEEDTLENRIRIVQNYNRNLLDLNILNEIDRNADQKTILVIAGMGHTNKLLEWLGQLDYTIEFEKTNSFIVGEEEPDAINLSHYLPSKWNTFKRYAKKAFAAIPFAAGLGITVKTYLQNKTDFLPLACGVGLSSLFYSAFHYH